MIYTRKYFKRHFTKYDTKEMMIEEVVTEIDSKAFYYKCHNYMKRLIIPITVESIPHNTLMKLP